MKAHSWTNLTQYHSQEAKSQEKIWQKASQWKAEVDQQEEEAEEAEVEEDNEVEEGETSAVLAIIN